jgi:hypothetical protein
MEKENPTHRTCKSCGLLLTITHFAVWIVNGRFSANEECFNCIARRKYVNKEEVAVCR